MNNPSKKEPNRIIPKLIIGVILGIIVIAGFLLIADLKKVTLTIREMPVHYLILAFLLTLGSYSLRLYKWHAFSKWSNFKIGLKDNVVIFLIGLMMSITPGKAGELIKSYLLQRKGNVPYSESIPVIIYDRLTDLLAMMALVGVGFLVYPFGLTPLLILTILIVLFFILVQKRSLCTKLINWLTRPKRLQRFRNSLHHFYKQTLFLMRLNILSFSFIISVAAWLLECISLYVIITAFSVDVSFIASIFTFSLGTLAGALSMIPGGLGAAEGSITGLLIYFGVAGSLAVTISLIIRFVTLWFGVFLGIIVFLVKRKSFLN
ncbi:lysylphosphatidylglycerol synthase transmembrane domain-containing protein [Lentibacillus sp. Marseille-P4043]|uniref:lysylphosphatidylglycerol synthase transmembrane domain-containing protein n=1 Tax=Lentibacillus sp. Marseille-P4043 TaxID=2040293 RepID=UPI00131A52F1|nr:lysylphosphatidylglycerol synthase transmembrane domain-containing protein [Lentibacillus sp. Marseille-P4043]